MPTLETIGKRFEAYLNAKAIGINQAGRDLSTSGTQILNIINGKKYGADKLLSIINTYEDLSVSYLIFGEGKMLNTDAQDHAQDHAQDRKKNKTDPTHFKESSEEEIVRAYQDIVAIDPDMRSVAEALRSYKSSKAGEGVAALESRIKQLEAKNEALIEALEAIGRGQGEASSKTA